MIYKYNKNIAKIILPPFSYPIPLRINFCYVPTMNPYDTKYITNYFICIIQNK